MRLVAQVIITHKIAKGILELESLKSDQKLVEIMTPEISKELEVLENASHHHKHLSFRITTLKENFVLDDAKIAIEKAYMASDVETFIILASNKFSSEVQSKLLKVIEEPPPRVSFILLTPFKAALLSTIRSRLPVTQIRERVEREAHELNMRELDLRSVYEFIQNNKRVSSIKAKELVEQISIDVMNAQKFDLDSATLQLMHNAYKALDLGSPPQFVLTRVLLKLLAKKSR